MTRRIGNWVYQPASRSWNFNGTDFYLHKRSVLYRGSTWKMWCSRCGLGYGPGSNYQRYRFYEVAPFWTVKHTAGKQAEHWAYWNEPGFWRYQYTGGKVCDHLIYRYGWAPKPPDWHGWKPKHGKCTCTHLLTVAIQRAERRIAQITLDSLAAL